MAEAKILSPAEYIYSSTELKILAQPISPILECPYTTFH